MCWFDFLVVYQSEGSLKMYHFMLGNFFILLCQSSVRVSQFRLRLLWLDETCLTNFPFELSRKGKSACFPRRSGKVKVFFPLRSTFRGHISYKCGSQINSRRTRFYIRYVSWVVHNSRHCPDQKIKSKISSPRRNSQSPNWNSAYNNIAK